jgi:hypothetical protein
MVFTMSNHLLEKAIGGCAEEGVGGGVAMARNGRTLSLSFAQSVL